MTFLAQWPFWRRDTNEGDADAAGDVVGRETARARKLFGSAPPEDMHPYAPWPPVKPVEYASYAPPRPPPRRETHSLVIVTLGLAIGAVAGMLLLSDDPAVVLGTPQRLAKEASVEAGFLNCAHVRLVLAAPLLRGEKGYSKALDDDGDGVACEPLLGGGDDKPAPGVEPAPEAQRQSAKRK